MSAATVGEVLPGLWRFQARHPEWTEDEGGEEDGWEPEVAWWVLAGADGAVLVDPLVEDWRALDDLAGALGGVAGIVRTCHWHERSIAEVAARYGAEVWARRPGAGPGGHLDHSAGDGEELFGAVRVIDVLRADEVALWLHAQRALLFGDAMLRRAGGELRVCPPTWTQPSGGYEDLLERLRGLRALPVEHVLVSHGPFVAGGGAQALERATG